MSAPAKVANPVQIIRAMLGQGRYGFALHAKQRLDERELTVAEVTQVIRRGVHEVGRDVYRPEFGDWNYAIGGGERVNETQDEKIQWVWFSRGPRGCTRADGIR